MTRVYGGGSVDDDKGTIGLGHGFSGRVVSTC